MSSGYIHSRLIPVRFVTMIGHFVMLVMAISCRDINVKSCLPYDYQMEDFIQKDKELVFSLLLGFAFIGLEMFSFLFGFSMFESLISVVSICAHSVACLLLSYWLSDTWDCTLYWIIFVLCSLVPGCIEFVVIVNVLAVKRVWC